MTPAQPITRCDKCRYIRYTGHGFEATFDYLVIHYAWVFADGRDLDTRTAILNTGSMYDGQTVGWAEQNTVGPGPNYYLQWGGDNTTPTGYESVLVNLKQLATDFPSMTEAIIRLRTYWFGEKRDAGFTLLFTTFNGGTMVPFTTSTGQTDWMNVGGTLGSTVVVPRISPTGPTGVSVPGDEEGIVQYAVPTKLALYVPPTFHILTESGSNIITEDGNRLITENAY